MNKPGRSMFAIAKQKLMPVVIINDVSQAEPLREALKQGGIFTAEVTLRTPNALRIIKIMSEDPDFCVGAGTVLSPGDVDKAQSAGAQFAVSPGLSIAVADECDRAAMPHFPGVATPTEIQRARDLGFNELKFFPAEALGGAQYLKAVVAPFHDMKFIPTGGINLSNVDSYLAVPQVLAVGGSWIVSEKLLAAGDFSAVTSLSREALAQMNSHSS
ncbi:MAG: bifunctional 4-hydroxy-2-oxoglutarate aldolase/2-dehydro-3-deoxy-phosphogluconate aldolase [Actinobacteria bacterium]|nr:bifunctional 4-hydroxy-2-oxoglutarate aldolase/2-dehydro-3-deoxy-phosphogluconate aldolase [Actinomycetota bacterium]